MVKRAGPQSAGFVIIRSHVGGSGCAETCTFLDLRCHNARSSLGVLHRAAEHTKACGGGQCATHALRRSIKVYAGVGAYGVCQHFGNEAETVFAVGVKAAAFALILAALFFNLVSQVLVYFPKELVGARLIEGRIKNVVLQGEFVDTAPIIETPLRIFAACDRIVIPSQLDRRLVSDLGEIAHHHGTTLVIHITCKTCRVIPVACFGRCQCQFGNDERTALAYGDGVCSASGHRTDIDFGIREAIAIFIQVANACKCCVFAIALCQRCRGAVPGLCDFIGGFEFALGLAEIEETIAICATHLGF